MIPPNKAVLPEPEAGLPDDPSEGMTERQKDELKALKEAAGEMYDPTLSREQADHEIGKLREIVGRE